MRRQLVILLVLCSVFLAIGCAEDGAEEDGFPAEEPVEEEVVEEEIVEDEAVEEEIVEDGIPPEVPDISSPEVVEVSIVDLSFEPEIVEISSGDTVRWINLDSVSHTVTGTGASFGSTTLAPGETYEFLFTDPGTYEYYCEIHPSMEGTVIVEEEE